MTEFIVNYRIQICKSIDELSENFAQILIEKVNNKNNDFNIALSGGTTPKSIFKYLAALHQNTIHWNKVKFYWGDERCVPPNDPESNYKMAYENLLSKVSISKENIFRIKGESDPKEESIRYSQLIKNNLKLINDKPIFDLIMLGLGEDGHTASIFPNHINLFQSDNIYEVTIHPSSGQKRITLTGKIINNASIVVFIVTGRNKSKILNDILNNKIESFKYPAARVKPVSGTLIWMLDEPAASLLIGN